MREKKQCILQSLTLIKIFYKFLFEVLREDNFLISDEFYCK